MQFYHTLIYNFFIYKEIEMKFFHLGGACLPPLRFASEFKVLREIIFQSVEILFLFGKLLCIYMLSVDVYALHLLRFSALSFGWLLLIRFCICEFYMA